MMITKKILKLFVLSLLFSPLTNDIAIAEKSTDLDPLILKQVLMAHEVIAHSKPSELINKQIVGSIVSINDKKYQIISFIFKDPGGQNLDETFNDYAKKHNLFIMKSQLTNPSEGIEFQVFDSKGAHTLDEVYFYLVLESIS